MLPIEAPPEYVEPYLAKGYDKNAATVYAMVEIMDEGIGQLINEEVIHFTDVFPILIDLCQLQPERHVPFEGGSMAGILFGTHKHELPEARFRQWNRGVPNYSHNAAMRKGKWKLVRPYITRDIPAGDSDIRPVLYDLELDPYEQYDVSRNNRMVYEEMNVWLEQWAREVEFRRLQVMDHTKYDHF